MPRVLHPVFLLFVLAPLGCLSGCASYATPGRAADFSAIGVTPQMREQMTDESVLQALDRKPLAAFPTGIAVVRIQSPGYLSKTNEGWGSGRYSVITTRDVETDAQVERLAKMPMVQGIAPINRLLLKPSMQSGLELRNAAAQLHADMVLVYTFDTTFFVNDMASPLTLISLGLSPNQQARIATTASAVLMDTRNGYVYGVAEASDRTTELTSAWTSRDTIDRSRIKTESAAFEKLVGELEKTWGRVVHEYAGGAKMAGNKPQ